MGSLLVLGFHVPGKVLEGSITARTDPGGYTGLDSPKLGLSSFFGPLGCPNTGGHLGGLTSLGLK